MSKTIKTLLIPLLILSVCAASYGQAGQPSPKEKTVTFQFVPRNDMFYTPWSGNDAQLERLSALVDTYRTGITAGAIPVYIDSYCASLPTPQKNLKTAFIRASRVKSELIQHKGLTEAHFITANYTHAYHHKKDIVVVTLRIPESEEPDNTPPEHQRSGQAGRERTGRDKAQAEAERAGRETEQARPPARQETERAGHERLAAGPPAVSAKPYTLALRTNVLCDAMLLPTLGLEWRINRHLGIRLDGSLSWWGNEKGKIQKMWLLNPEVRWYLLRDKRFYIGASGNYGQYNIYKYPIGSILSKNTGHQGSMWGAGVTVGYQLRLSRCFSADFNLGLGYTHFRYDTFGITDGVRVYKERHRSENFRGPAQAGISLVWTIKGNK